MKNAPRARADALHHWPEFEEILESEEDPRRKAFLEFIKSQSFVAVSQANATPQVAGDIVLDMRGVAALAYRLLEREVYLRRILDGEATDDDF